MSKQENQGFGGEEYLNDKENNLQGSRMFDSIKRTFHADFVTGLPCGELREFILASNDDNEVIHVPATNERESVGIAAGAWLGGKQPILYMQNSGLFESSNDLGSLLVASRIPAVLVVSWRGAPGETATQHLATGGATKSMLTDFGIEHTDIASQSSIDLLKSHQEQTDLPVCVLQKRETYNNLMADITSVKPIRTIRGIIREEDCEFCSREEILSVIARTIPESSAIVSSTGLISRSLYHYYDSPNQFYNAGAFGLTSSIALGFSLAQPERSVVAVEGDGSVLTNLGNLNLIGHYQPEKFLHVVLDNEAYASCSGEPTIGSYLIPQLASVFGYNQVFSVSTPDAVRAIIEDFQFSGSGAIMLHVKINDRGERNFKRPLEMSLIARRFKNHFQY